MNNYFEVIASSSLFENLSREHVQSVLGCLGAEYRSYKKDEILLLAGYKPTHIGLVLSGQIHLERQDIDGVRSLVAALMPGDIFGESLCCADVDESPVTVVADGDSVVLLLDFTRLLTVCSNTCVFHTRLIRNMMEVIAKKNLQLQARMEILSQKSVRGKILRYLEGFVSSQGREITIPFDREELADHLCVERSALSHELSRMKKDGLIDYRKNKFSLKTLHLPS